MASDLLALVAEDPPRAFREFAKLIEAEKVPHRQAELMAGYLNALRFMLMQSTATDDVALAPLARLAGALLDLSQGIQAEFLKPLAAGGKPSFSRSTHGDLRAAVLAARDALVGLKFSAGEATRLVASTIDWAPNRVANLRNQRKTLTKSHTYRLFRRALASASTASAVISELKRVKALHP